MVSGPRKAQRDSEAQPGHTGLLLGTLGFKPSQDLPVTRFSPSCPPHTHGVRQHWEEQPGSAPCPGLVWGDCCVLPLFLKDPDTTLGL